MKKLNYSIIFLVLLCSGCAINYPALPDKSPLPSKELKYIYKTDQKDRRRVLIKLITKKYEDVIKDPKIILISDRDSIRLSRVIYLNQQNLIVSNEDKFYAASIYDHEGGIKMKQDTTYFRIAYTLFKELYDKGYKRGMTKSLMNTSYDRWQQCLSQKQ